MSKQLALFDPLDFDDGSDLPIPMRAADHFGFSLQHHDEMYSVQDWVAGLTDLQDAALRNEVKRCKTYVTSDVTYQKMPYVDTLGRTYQRDFMDNRGLYQIVAYLEHKEDRPTLKDMKAFLADAGVLVEQIASEPLRAAERIKGIVSRKEFTAALVEVVTNLPPTGVGVATNDVYRGVFRRDTKQLRQQLQTSNPRDKLSHIALSYLSIAEWISSQQLGNAQEITFDQARSIIKDVCGVIGAQTDEIERRMGIDVVTGRRLLDSTDAIRGWLQRSSSSTELIPTYASCLRASLRRTTPTRCNEHSRNCGGSRLRSNN